MVLGGNLLRKMFFPAKYAGFWKLISNLIRVFLLGEWGGVPPPQAENFVTPPSTPPYQEKSLGRLPPPNIYSLHQKLFSQLNSNFHVITH